MFLETGTKIVIKESKFIFTGTSVRYNTYHVYRHNSQIQKSSFWQAHLPNTMINIFTGIPARYNNHHIYKHTSQI